jgi:DNA-binding XRE family transcriptional regulator
MALNTITRKGRRYVLVPEEEYERLNGDSLPAFPPIDADGTSNAIDFARAAIARRLIADRHAAGLSQQQLAERAGVRQETISRIESGKQTATVRIIDKLDGVIRGAIGGAKRRAGKKIKGRRGS